MAKTTGTSDILIKLALLVVLVWLLMLTYSGNLFGQLGLGVLLVVTGIWTLARSKETWNKYLASWKKLPKNKRNEWLRPRRRYYYINVVILVPLAIGVGLALIASAYMYSL